jgi:hypothetical protein
VESPADKPFGEGMQDTPTTKPVHDRFGMPPQPAQVLWIKACPDCTQTGMRARGALIPPEGQL